MNLNNTQELQKNKTYALTATALMTAVTCILAPLSVPIGPVPISLTNFVIFLSLYLLNWKKGTLSLLIYLLLGLAGLPVFSGFAGGIAKLAGPTGGYIIGFIPMAKNQNRITAIEKEVENEKYAFRCFLLRLGFIGEQYKKERKILLQNLSGSAAFKNNKDKGGVHEVSEQSDSREN